MLPSSEGGPRSTVAEKMKNLPEVCRAQFFRCNNRLTCSREDPCDRYLLRGFFFTRVWVWCNVLQRSEKPKEDAQKKHCFGISRAAAANRYARNVCTHAALYTLWRMQSLRPRLERWKKSICLRVFGRPNGLQRMNRHRRTPLRRFVFSRLRADECVIVTPNILCYRTGGVFFPRVPFENREIKPFVQENGIKKAG